MTAAVGPYALLAEIGSGSSGRVYRARREGSAGDVALKLLDPRLASDPDAVYRFGRELRIAAALEHPNLVRVLESGEHEGTPYLVMELVDGPSLDRTMRERGAVPWPEAVRIANGLAAGLACLHAGGIAHRDLKPSNVLLASDGTARLCDFGLARAADSTRVTQTGAFIGTLRYMAPEMLTGDAATQAADLWSFGFILYQLLAGEPPLTGTDAARWVQHVLTTPIRPLGEACPDAPEKLAAVTMAMLERDPARRPTAAAVLEVLARLPREGNARAKAPASRLPGNQSPARAAGVAGAPGAPGNPINPSAQSPPRAPSAPPTSRAGLAISAAAALVLAAIGGWLLARRPAPVAVVSVVSPAPSPSASVAALPFPAESVRAAMRQVDERAASALPLRSEVVHLVQPAARHYTAGRKALKQISVIDRADLAQLTPLVEKLDAAVPDLARLSTPDLVLAARLVLNRLRCWCGANNCTLMDRVLERAEREDPGFAGGLEIANAMDADPFDAAVVPQLLRGIDLIELVARRVGSAPTESGPDLAEYFLDVRCTAYLYAFRPFPADSRTRLTGRLATLRSTLPNLPGPCGAAMGRLTLALYDHGSGRAGGLKKAAAELRAALNALVAVPDGVPAAKEIRSTLEARLVDAQPH